MPTFYISTKTTYAKQLAINLDLVAFMKFSEAFSHIAGNGKDYYIDFGNTEGKIIKSFSYNTEKDRASDYEEILLKYSKPC